MAGERDLRDFAVNTTHDLYAFLEIAPESTDSEIRRAYRRSALKYHPDKAVGDPEAARKKFDLLTLANEVLHHADLRQLYDNARRAREQKKEREAGHDAHRRALIDKLERGERAAGLKRDRVEETEEEREYRQRAERIGAINAQKRAELVEKLRREREEEFEHDVKARNGGCANETPTPTQTLPEITEEDRTIKVRHTATKALTCEEVSERFSKFGEVDYVVLNTKIKGKKEITTALVAFKSIVGAHAAVADMPGLRDADTKGEWSCFNKVNWMGGKEPELIAKSDFNRSETTDLAELTRMDEMTRIRLKKAGINKRLAEADCAKEEDAGETIVAPSTHEDATGRDPDKGAKPKFKSFKPDATAGVPKFRSFKPKAPTGKSAPENARLGGEAVKERQREEERQPLMEEIRMEDVAE